MANPFKDMKESAKAQHQVDKANFAAVKAEGQAIWEEAKLSPKARQEMMRQEQVEHIEIANKKKANADKRIENAKSLRK